MTITRTPRVQARVIERRLERWLALLGALLMPLGVACILLAWYGAAHTPHVFEQLPYLISGGLLGLASTFIGGFLFFASWLARQVHQQQTQTELLTTALSRLADSIEQSQK